MLHNKSEYEKYAEVSNFIKVFYLYARMLDFSRKQYSTNGQGDKQNNLINTSGHKTS